MSNSLLWKVTDPQAWKFPVPFLPKVRLMIPRLGLMDVVAICFLALYLLACGVLFTSWVEPSLRGSSEWRIGADSSTYEVFAENLYPFLSVTENEIGPVMEASLLKERWAFAVFNVTLFLASLLMLRQVRFWIFLFWVLINPLTFSALLTLNKEIFAFVSAVALWRWLHDPRKRWLALALISAFCARWEQVFVIIVFFVMRRIKRRNLAMLGLIILISLVLALALSYIEIEGFEEHSASSRALTALEAKGLYFADFPVKLAIALTSRILLFWEPFFDSRRLHDLQTGLFVLGNQLCMCAALGWLALKKRLELANDVAYFLLIYAMIFCAAPLNQPRYFYAIYVLAALAISELPIPSKKRKPSSEEVLGYAR